MFLFTTSDQRIQFEKAILFYKNAYNSFFGIIILSVFYNILFWDNLSKNYLLIWDILILVINIPRLMITILFHKRLEKQIITLNNFSIYLKIYQSSLMISGLSWSVIPFFPYIQNHLLNYLYIVILLIGLSSAAILSFSISRKIVLSYISVIMIPLTIRLFIDSNSEYITLGVLSFTFYLMMIRLIFNLHKTIMSNIRLILQNENSSLTDPLTGLGNRRRLDMFMETLIPYIERRNSTFSIIILDIDHFKKYNDTYGHRAGDEVLKSVSNTIIKLIRGEDLGIRFGGEEFLIILPDTPIEQARSIAERIRLGIKEHTPVTISGGVASYNNFLSFDQIIEMADQSLYTAKNNGRDQIN